jgi:phage portal protein BeeE
MKLFGYNLSLTRVPAAKPSFRTPHSAVRTYQDAFLRGEDLPSDPVLANAYQQVVWVYRAINALAEQVANIPFRFSYDQAGGDHLITSGPLPDFYARPHPHLNRFQYWELRIIWLMLRGECVRVPIYGRSDRSDWSDSAPRSPGSSSLREDGHAPRPLRSVLLLDPAQFQHLIENHRLAGWRYTGFGPEAPLEARILLPEEVWFERLPNPFDFWRGLPPLALAAMAARTDFAAGAFMQGIMENNGDNGLIIRTERELEEEQQEQLLAALRDRKRKAGTADRPLLLWNTAEIIKPELSSSDLQFLENRKFSRAEICAAFGVPEEIVTSTENAKYDVMTGARLNFIENRVIPLCRRLEAEEAATVKALDPRAEGWFDLDSLPILQDARRSRLASARTGFDMGIPFNELNRVLDLGFKPLPWGNRGFLPGTVQAVGENAVETPVRCASDPTTPSAPPARLLDLLANLLQPAGVAQTFESAVPQTFLSALDTANPNHPHASRSPKNPELPGLAPCPPPASSAQPAPPLEERKVPATLGQTQSSAHTARRCPILRKLRRYLFEQRARVLSAITSNPATPPLDLPTENRLLLLALNPVLRAQYQTALAETAQAQHVPVPTPAAAQLDDFLASREPDLLELNQSTAAALALVAQTFESAVPQTFLSAAQAPVSSRPQSAQNASSAAALTARVRAHYNTLAAETSPAFARREQTIARQSAALFVARPADKTVCGTPAGSPPPPNSHVP